MKQAHSWMWAGVVILACALAVQAQQADSSTAASANVSAQVAPGAVPRLIKFTGVVHDLTGKVPAGAVGLTFSLYPLPEGGAPLWVETQSVQLDSLGGYTVLLGANSPGGLPLDLFTTGTALWLGVQPQWSGMSEQPRVLLVAVPYALKAADADTLGGKPASAYALSGAQTLVVPVTGAASAPAASTPALAANPSGDRMAAAVQPATACTSVTADGNAAANQVALYSGPCALTESTTFVDVAGKVGIGTASPLYPLDVQFTSTATSGSLLGHRVLATLNPAAASSAGTYGSYSLVQTASGNTQNFTGFIESGRFLTYHYGTGTLSSAYGMNGTVSNAAGGTLTSAYGVWAGLSNTSTGTITNGYGVYVAPPSNSGGGTFSNYYGLYLVNPTAATKNFSIYSAGGTNYFAGNVGIGTASPTTNLEVVGNLLVSGSGHGITFPDGTTQTSANNFTGNFGVVDSTVGGTGLSVQTTDITTGNIAIDGLADGAGGSGVIGEAENGSLAVGVWGLSSSGLAGLFSGNVSILGNLSKSGGSFKIDDPIDPANKYLYHSFVESPDMKNIYDGVAVLDAKGEVVVQLPDWFGALNSDFRYQLTCIGGFAPVYIAEKINQNHFKIAGGKPGLEVSWQVTGIRQDAWANAHRIPVEVEKPAGEQGYYVHPELFGQPAQKSIEWADHPQQMKRLAARDH